MPESGGSSAEAQHGLKPDQGLHCTRLTIYVSTERLAQRKQVIG